VETRKVQLSGGTTYTVSLPKVWAREHGIEAGSVLALHPNDDGSLLVESTVDRETAERSATVDVGTDDEATVGRTVRAAYTVGLDSLTLVDRTGHPTERRQAVEEALRGLSGFEVLETTDSRIVLRNLIDAENVGVGRSANRLRLVMLAMHRDAVTAVVDGDEDLARQVVRRDEEADKLFAMVTRYFRRSLYDLAEIERLERSRDDLFELYYAARQFERVADHAVKVAGFALEPGGDVAAAHADRVSALARDSRGLVDDAADVVLGGAGCDAATDVLAAHGGVVERIEAFDRDLYDHDDPSAAYVLGLVVDSLRRTADYGANVAEVGLECSLRTGLDDR
jgi:phosphate uptake regulator